MVRHRWISQDGKACLLASWFLSRDVAVHSGVVGASAPAPRCFKFRRKTRPGDPGGTTTADATVWQNPCSAAGGLYVVQTKCDFSVLSGPWCAPPCFYSMYQHGWTVGGVFSVLGGILDA